MLGGALILPPPQIRPSLVLLNPRGLMGLMGSFGWYTFWVFPEEVARKKVFPWEGPKKSQKAIFGNQRKYSQSMTILAHTK